jgi:hypothetical protein
MTAGNGLYISEPEPRERGAILISDEDSNDIAEFFHNEHATVDQSYETALALAQRLVGSPAQGKQSEPVLWQWQAPNSERWLTEEGEGSSDPDIRERLILLGYKFRPLYAVLPAEGRPDWKALDNLEDAAEAIFKILSPGLPYTAEDAFWYRQAAHAVLERCSPAANDTLRSLIGRLSDYFRVNAKRTDSLAQGYIRELDALIATWPSQPDIDNKDPSNG